MMGLFSATQKKLFCVAIFYGKVDNKILNIE